MDFTPSWKRLVSALLELLNDFPSIAGPGDLEDNPYISIWHDGKYWNADFLDLECTVQFDEDGYYFGFVPDESMFEVVNDTRNWLKGYYENIKIN